MDPAERPAGIPAPVLVLGLGNLLLGDDGLGLCLLERLEALAPRWGKAVEFVDGGTQGMALLGFLEGRRSLLLLDAVALHRPPGTVAVLEGPGLQDAMPGAASTSHEGNAGDLLRAAALVGGLPPEVAVVGLEPLVIRTGIGLSSEVEGGLQAAVDAAAAVLDRMVAGVS